MRLDFHDPAAIVAESREYLKARKRNDTQFKKTIEQTRHRIEQSREFLKRIDEVLARFNGKA